VVKALKRD